MNFSLKNALLGGAIAIGIAGAMLLGHAFAVTGTPPVSGFQLVDGTWLNGLAGGINNSYIYNLTAAGTTQGTGVQIPSAYQTVEFDTVAASTGANLPFAYQGTEMYVYNNGANTLTIYPNALNNPLTSAQDTINNTTSVTVSSHTADIFFSAKNGVWAAK